MLPLRKRKLVTVAYCLLPHPTFLSLETRKAKTAIRTELYVFIWLVKNAHQREVGQGKSIERPLYIADSSECCIRSSVTLNQYGQHVARASLGFMHITGLSMFDICVDNVSNYDLVALFSTIVPF